MSATTYVYEKMELDGVKIYNLNAVAHPHGGIIISFIRVVTSDVHEICITHFNRNKGTWSEKKAIYSVKSHEAISFVIYLDLKADLVLMINENNGIKILRSNNYGKTWSNPMLIFNEPNHYVFKNQPIFVESGKTLIPIHEDMLGRSLALISEDNGKSWYISTYIELDLGDSLEEYEFEDSEDISNQKRTNFAANRIQAIFPVFIHQSELNITAFMQAVKFNKIFQANSDDLGETWLEAIPTAIEATEGPIDAIRIIDREGNYTPAILLLKLDYISKNIRLRLEHSNDGGENWKSITSIFDCIPSNSFKNISDCCITQEPQESLVYLIYISDKKQVNLFSFSNTNLM